MVFDGDGAQQLPLHPPSTLLASLQNGLFFLSPHHIAKCEDYLWFKVLLVIAFALRPLRC